MTVLDLRALIDVLPEPLLLVESSGEIHLINHAAAALLGLNGDGAGRSLFDRVDGEATDVRKFLAACSRTRSLIPGALRLRGPDGTTAMCRCSGAAARPRTAEAPALLLLRLQPEEQASSRFVLLNRKIEDLSHEIRVRLKVEAERARLLAQERELRQQLEMQATELEQQTEEAQQLSEELEQSNEQLGRALSVAEAANRAKSDFLAMMSHELRTPINATLGYLELLMLGLRGPLNDEQSRDIERVRRNQQHLLRVVTDILTFSRADGGKLEFDLTEVVVRDVLQTVSAMLEPLARDRHISLTVQSCDQKLVVRADHAKLEQILVNLISNAFKFSPPGERVSISCAAKGDRGEISVEDRGPGIPADKLEHIFEPFVQLDATLTRRVEGTGLGLTISREFARGMGGDLTVVSGPQGGATFTLSLPRERPT